jgi:hypothetical protein
MPNTTTPMSLAGARSLLVASKYVLVEDHTSIEVWMRENKAHPLVLRKDVDPIPQYTQRCIDQILNINKEGFDPVSN